MRLCVLLRLALLHRARASSLRVQPLLRMEGDRLRLGFPKDWLARHPLLRTELEQEAIRLEPAVFQLDFNETTGPCKPLDWLENSSIRNRRVSS